jgi:glutamine synthetase
MESHRLDLGDIREKIRDQHINRLKLCAVDTDGVLRGKWISIDKFWAVVDSTIGFCDVVFGWDIDDSLYDNVEFTGWHTGYPDAQARIDIQTFRIIPWEEGTAMFLLDFVDREGQPLEIAPRQVLQRVLGLAEKMGYLPSFSTEYEFFLFRETAESLREKGYANLTPLTPGMFGYSILRASANSPVLIEMLNQLNAFEVPLEGLHTETGPGVFEAALAHADALQAADRATLFKTAVKEIAGRHGLIPTFMAKWNPDLPGSSGHIHQSLWDEQRKGNLFAREEGEADAGSLPPLMRHYIAGLIANLPELIACFCPTVNSYKRIVPGFWAPVNATWGIDNRTTAVRAIPSSGKSSRVELRVTGADINPYIAVAASLAAGLDGIQRQLPLPEPVVNAYRGAATPLARTLAEATSRLRQSEIARKWLGSAFVDHYAATREWEVRQFEKAVTNWELARYFESI